MRFIVDELPLSYDQCPFSTVDFNGPNNEMQRVCTVNNCACNLSDAETYRYQIRECNGLQDFK